MKIYTSYLYHTYDQSLLFHSIQNIINLCRQRYQAPTVKLVQKFKTMDSTIAILHIFDPVDISGASWAVRGACWAERGAYWAIRWSVWMILRSQRTVS